MPSHSQTRVASLRTTTALVCFSMASLQAHAQSVISEPLSLLRQEAEHTRFSITVQYADLLELTYNQIVRDMRSWDAQSGHETTLAHMAANDVLPNGVFRRLNTEELTRWNIRARLCDDQLIVYYGDNNFKSGITPTEIRRAQKERLHRNGDVIGATRKNPLAWVDASELVLQSGERVAIPRCFDADYATPLPRGGVAFIGRARPDNLYAKDKEWPEFRRDICVAPQVGAGRHMTRTRFDPVDHRGRRPKDESGNFIWPSTYGPWTLHLDNCYDALTSEFMDASTTCTRSLLGKAIETPALYRWKMKQVQDPSDPFKVVWVMVDPDGSVVAKPQGELVQSLCDNPPPAPTVATNVVEDQETRPQDCQIIYPDPPFLKSIGYRDGEYIEERTKSTFTQTYDFDRDPIKIVSYSPWGVKEDTCSRPLVRAHYWENVTLACPAGSLGTHSLRRRRQDEMIDYAKDFNTNILTIPASNVRIGEWETVENLCYGTTDINSTENRSLGCPAGQTGSIHQNRQRTSVISHYHDPVQRWREATTVTYTNWATTSSFCSASGGDGDGGGNNESVDVNGDGIGDFSDPADATVAGFDIGSQTSVNGTCGPCNGPSEPGTGSVDGGEGGPGGKIVCTAMNARYGFGTFRQTIWLTHARKHLTPYHQTGYHMMALPLIRYAYTREGLGSRLVRASMEHMARERTADIWAQKRGTQRRPLGRLYRGILEPLSYGLGRLAKGRTIAGVKDVPALASRNPQKGLST